MSPYLLLSYLSLNYFFWLDKYKFRVKARKKVAIFLIAMLIFPKQKSNSLVRQAKLVRFSWLRSQPDKVNRPSEPSFASIRVIVWVKRKQGSSRP